MEDGGGVCQAILSGLSRGGLGERWRVSFHFLRSSSSTRSAKPASSKTSSAASKTSEVQEKKLTNTNHVLRPAGGGGGPAEWFHPVETRKKRELWRGCGANIDPGVSATPLKANSVHRFRPEKRGRRLCKRECGFSARGSATPLGPSAVNVSRSTLSRRCRSMCPLFQVVGVLI